MVDKLVTDIGGEPAGAVPQEDRDQLFWEKQMEKKIRNTKSVDL